MGFGPGQEFPLAMMLLAAALIALGRMHIRRARRAATEARRLRRKHFMGWLLLACGLMLMILGAVLW